MPKKIVILPDECPSHKIYGGSHYCEHPNGLSRYCNWIPSGCPMTTEELRRLKIEKIKKYETKSIFSKR